MVQQDDVIERTSIVTYALLEELHAGISPSSRSGDFTDVKVVTPEGEIPWSRLSRLSEAEMRAILIEAVNRVYTMLTVHPDDLRLVRPPKTWRRPERSEALLAQEAPAGRAEPGTHGSHHRRGHRYRGPWHGTR